MTEIHLYEQIYLLTIDEITGRVLKSAKQTLNDCLAGALLDELELLGKLKLDENLKIVVSNASPGGDPALDRALQQIQEAKSPHKAGYWVGALSSEHLQRQTRNRLIETGLLRREQGHSVALMPAAPDEKISSKYRIKGHLRDIILGGDAPSQNDILLLSLARAAGLLGVIFTKDERRLASQKIKAMGAGEAFGQAVRKAVKKATRFELQS